MAVLLALGGAVVPEAQGYVYWANATSGAGTTLGRANLDGTGADQSFITGASSPLGVAVDAAHIYWANHGSGGSGTTLGRANLDGTGADQSFITGASGPYGVAVDAAHVYWANSISRAIGRANLDGTGADQSFITTASSPSGVAVDAAHVYWANSTSRAIGRANLDGTGADQSFITGVSYPYGVAVDAAHIYWANATSGVIGRANLDGTGAVQSFITGVSYPYGVAVDAAHVYWTNVTAAGGGAIGRANLDGTAADQSFITGGYPYGVAVDASTGPPGQPPPGQRPECVDSTTLLVTCASNTRLPGVCGPSFGTIFPPCYLPTVMPTVCGPSFGTILPSCQLPQSLIMACGGFGTILPQCTTPPTSIAQICGPSSTILPPCTGANNPVLACGPSSGTPLPPCRFTTQIKASAPLKSGKPGQIDINLSCPAQTAVTTTAVHRARAAKKAPTCDLSVALDIMRTSLLSLLDDEVQPVASEFRRATSSNSFSISEEKAGANDQAAFLSRTRQIARRFLSPSASANVDRAAVYAELQATPGNPPYIGGRGLNETNVYVILMRGWIGSLDRAVTQYRKLQTCGCGRSSSLQAGDAALKRARLVTAVKVRHDRRTSVRIKLPRSLVTFLVREARSSRSKRVVPIRLVISYLGTLEGKRIPVARVIDTQLRVK